MQHKVRKTKVWGAALIFGLVILSGLLITRTAKTFTRSLTSLASLHSVNETDDLYPINKEAIASRLGEAFRAGEFPTTVELNAGDESTRASVLYGLDDLAQAEMEKVISRYKPDYGAFVAMDATTGRILSMVSYSRVNPELDNLALRATFPAASIFKVVTASAAIDLNKAQAGTVVPFNGANHTLYKRNVNSTQVNRWTRKMTMKEAFGKSVNVFFGKLGLFYVGPDNLLRYAERFLFNQPIRSDVPVQTAFARFSSDDPWSVVTAASGYTRENTLSPVHGAMIAAAIANDGVMMEPYLVESITDPEGETMYQAVPKQASVVVGTRAADELRSLFRQTVKSGTSRKAFRTTVRGPKYEDVEFGGKTGSLTGMDPFGKNDWFIGYMRYRDQRIAVAALTVNVKKWRVKSSTLANLYFTNYLKHLKKREVAQRD